MRRAFYVLIAAAVWVAQAPIASAAEGWTTTAGTVTRVMIQNRLVVVTTEAQGGNHCGWDGWYFWPADTTMFPDHKEQYAIVLSAFLTGRKIKFWTNDADCWGQVTGASRVMTDQ